MIGEKFNKLQGEALNKLIREDWKKSLAGHKNTKQEQDLFNLKHMLFSITYGSIEFIDGYIGTLERAIKRLEKEMEKDVN